MCVRACLCVYMRATVSWLVCVSMCVCVFGVRVCTRVVDLAKEVSTVRQRFVHRNVREIFDVTAYEHVSACAPNALKTTTINTHILESQRTSTGMLTFWRDHHSAVRVHLHALGSWLTVLAPSSRCAWVVVSRGKSGAQLGCREQVCLLEGDGGGGHPREDVVGVGAVGDGGVSGSDVRAV